MPSVEFYYIPESPPCRAVEMVANMIGVTLNKHYVNLFKKEHLEDEYRKINPRTKVPFMIDGDVKIGESRAIIRYLINKYKPDDDKLYPKDPVKRAYIDESLDFEVGTLFPLFRQLFGSKFRGIVTEWDSNDEKNVKDALKYIDDKLAKIEDTNQFLVGNDITIADISMSTLLSFPGIFEYDLSDYKHLTAYQERLRAAIPKYSEINDEPCTNLNKAVASIQAGITDPVYKDTTKVNV